MKKIAIYARYSSDNQNDKSVDDQISECKSYIANEDTFSENVETQIFSDRAISGRNSYTRNGYNDLKKAIRNGAISYLIADSLDRLSRDMEDTSSLYKLCQYNDVEIRTIQDGKINRMVVGFKGTMNDIFLDNLAHQVKRSQRSRAKEGKMFGLPYGYKIKLRDGREVRGEREIDETKAKVVQNIFTLYAEDHSLGSIVEILNARGIPSPKNSKWTRPSLMGSILRKEGILCNDIYHGKVIWNLKSKKINPETGGKNYIVNPENEWEVTQNEELRIIPDTLWAECNIRKYRKKTKSNGKIERIRKKNPFHSLIFCGVCGDNKNLANSQRYVCSGFKYHKTCANGRGMKFNEILIHIFQFLRSEIEKISSKDWDDKIFKEFAQEKLLEIDLGKELEQVDQNISNVVSLIDEGIGFDQVREKLRDLQEKKAELTVKLNNSTPTIKTNIKKFFLSSIFVLYENMKTPKNTDEDRVQLNILVKKVILYPKKSYHGETIHIDMQPDAWVSYYRLLQNQQS